MKNTFAFKMILPQWSLLSGAMFMALVLFAPISGHCDAKPRNSKDHNYKDHTGWSEYFNVDSCNFSSIGRNEYFILEPNYILILSGKEGEDSVVLKITVLGKTKKIGNVETRVVEEEERFNGKLREISRNYYAFCLQTGSIFYFGEDIDAYRDEQIVGHEGSWKADSANVRAGLLIPGTVLLGAKYYTEIAPGTALDRAEIISTSEVLHTPAGTFDKCLKIRESSPVEIDAKDYKVYAPGIGLIKDGKLLLTKKGFGIQ